MVTMEAKKPHKPSEQLRQIILDCGMSRYEIAKQSGVTEAALSRFVVGMRGLTTDTVDRLAKVLELELVAKRSARKSKGRTKKGR